MNDQRLTILQITLENGITLFDKATMKCQVIYRSNIGDHNIIQEFSYKIGLV